MPEVFENVAVVAKANVYFDGKVSSRTVRFADGSEKTLGFMLPGEYEFGTAKPELMEVTAGSMEAKLPGSNDWQVYAAGQSFDVPGDSKFQVRVGEFADYICSFID